MRGLRERGVLVRGGGALGGEAPALRVTYGLPEENARFLDALAEVLAPRRAERPSPAGGAIRGRQRSASLDRRAIVCYKPSQTAMHRDGTRILTASAATRAVLVAPIYAWRFS